MINKKFKSHSQATMESRKKTSDQIQFCVPKGEREKIKAYALSKGVTMNEFIRIAIKKTMEE